MSKKKEFARYIRMLLPALLVAVLVLDAIVAYEEPDFSAGQPIAETAKAAAAPKLEMKQQKKKETKEPAGSAGALAAADESGTYKDGTYTGSGTGFGGQITVKVTIKGGKIAGIKIVSASGEDASFLGKAKGVLSKILAKQSTNVDAVSGATYSSNGIIMAVRNALSKAQSGSAAPAKEPAKQGNKNGKGQNGKKKQPAKKPEAVKTGTWADGTYKGTGEGFGGKLEVTVVIKDGKIQSVTVGKNSDDEEYLGKAKKGLIPQILKKQGTNVDTVSGATYSSVGIIEAVNDALAKAVKKNEEKNGKGSGSDGAPAVKPGGQNSDGKDGTKAEDLSGQKEEQTSITKTAMVYCDEYEDFEDYELSVTFVIAGGKVIDIKDAVQGQGAEGDNDQFIRLAIRGIKSQLAGKPDMRGIDTVSGATCSSLSIISAGQDALIEYNSSAGK